MRGWRAWQQPHKETEQQKPESRMRMQRDYSYISKFKLYITPLWNAPYSFAMNTPENNHVRMTDILTYLRCNHSIAFRQALIRCVHCGFVAWYRAESATGTISYKQTPPTNTQVRIFQTTVVFHICRLRLSTTYLPTLNHHTSWAIHRWSQWW